ncbi:bacteriocin-like protein [Elizabethkingia miricola]|uniref:bacteriocin-like protein n=1 Tax=Elizabethkingia miricola TaxID=172045 RepID=UPI00389175AE
MKNLKKINRENLKSITGGRPPAGGGCEDSCPPGTRACYYRNGNGSGGGYADIICV